MSDAVDLRVDWCSYEAAKYAVEKWHYSQTVPAGKNVYLGAWEDGRFIGAVIIGTGASSSLGGPYGLKWNECSELVRVALSRHRCRVSSIVSKAIRLFSNQSPNIRLLVSFADPREGHVGSIYQAMNWIYTGKSQDSTAYELNGKLLHTRAFTVSAWYGGVNRKIPAGATKTKLPGKHRYLYPLDRAMRKQIAPLAQPYPKRESCGPGVEGDTAIDQVAGAGSIPAARSID